MPISRVPRKSNAVLWGWLAGPFPGSIPDMNMMNMVIDHFGAAGSAGEPKVISPAQLAANQRNPQNAAGPKTATARPLPNGMPSSMAGPVGSSLNYENYETNPNPKIDKPPVNTGYLAVLRPPRHVKKSTFLCKKNRAGRLVSSRARRAGSSIATMNLRR